VFTPDAFMQAAVRGYIECIKYLQSAGYTWDETTVRLVEEEVNHPHYDTAYYQRPDGAILCYQYLRDNLQPASSPP
jgi:hypothetical protein